MVTPRKPIKRRKPRAQRKELSIKVRVTAEVKAQLTAGAAKTGLGVGPWLVMLGLREAQSKLS